MFCPMRPPADKRIAILGSGFGGSLLASIARQLGWQVLLIERGRHPRFAIGESSTPMANWLLEDLGREYALPWLAPLAKYGPWQRAYPNIACGLKRGFTFLRHDLGQPFSGRREDQLLVAASPNDEIADTHWYRPDFDAFLVRQAISLGVEYSDETKLESVECNGDGVTIRATRHGETKAWRADCVIDASGPRGAWFDLWGQQSEMPAGMVETQALYAHFREVPRVDAQGTFGSGTPPYPPDDAALHHCFEGGWIWVLRFNNGITSAGVSMRKELAQELQLHEGEAGWRRLLERFPTVKQHLGKAQRVTEWYHADRVSFLTRQVVGPRWSRLPSAVTFVDPLFSTGFTLTLLGISRLAELLKAGSVPDQEQPRWREYEHLALQDAEAVGRLTGAAFANLGQFDRFIPLTRIYFAAALWAETSRRLGKPFPDGFLLFADPAFRAQAFRCFEQLGDPAMPAWVCDDATRALIEPFDLAGLLNPNRGNWHPARAADLFANAHKIGATIEELSAMLRACGMQF